MGGVGGKQRVSSMISKDDDAIDDDDGNNLINDSYEAMIQAAGWRSGSNYLKIVLSSSFTIY